MNRNLRPFFTLIFATGFYLSAAAFHPKSIPGINDKTGSGTGTGDDKTEVKLPVGLPFQITDQTPSSSDGNETGGVSTASPANIIYTFDLPDGVGPESVHETHSAFQQARNLNAACVLIHMNSFSNALDAAENLNYEMMDYDRPVMVYVNNRAIPASTLINMAEENKSSQPDKNSGLKTGKRFIQKNSSSTFNSKTKNSPADFYSDEISCTSSQINQTHILNAQAANLNDVLEQAGMEKFTVVHYSAGFFSNVIDWCMKPLASLFFIFLIAIGMRIQTKSVFPGPATFLLMVCLPLFGVPLFMGGVASAGELFLLVFLCVTWVIATKRKSKSPWFKFTTAIFLVAAFTLSEIGNIAGKFDYKMALTMFGLSAIAFVCGWFAPILFSANKRKSPNSISLSSAV